MNSKLAITIKTVSRIACAYISLYFLVLFQLAIKTRNFELGLSSLGCLIGTWLLMEMLLARIKYKRQSK